MSGQAFIMVSHCLTIWVFPDDFTSEQLELFNARLSEGYDQFADTDYSYMRWLEQYHPEALPPDHYTLSVSDVFSSVSLLTPVDNADTPTTSSGSSLRTKDQPTKAISSGSAVKEGTSGKADKNVATIVTSTPSGSAKVSPGSGASSSTGDSKKHSSNESLMYKYLVDPTATPSAPKKTRPRARLLTSVDSWRKRSVRRRRKWMRKRGEENGGEREAKQRARRKEEKERGGTEEKAAAAKRPPKRKPAGKSCPFKEELS